MLEYAARGVCLMILVACSGASSEESTPAASAGGDAEETAALGPTPSSSMPPDRAFASFVDPATGQALQDVRDADREIVRFDSASQSMIWAADGYPVGGWITTGNDLRWQRGGAFRVRFGSEGGERRAYFTEADRGTICNLAIDAPESLSISSTSETPPGS